MYDNNCHKVQDNAKRSRRSRDENQEYLLECVKAARRVKNVTAKMKEDLKRLKRAEKSLKRKYMKVYALLNSKMQKVSLPMECFDCGKVKLSVFISESLHIALKCAGSRPKKSFTVYGFVKAKGPPMFFTAKFKENKKTCETDIKLPARIDTLRICGVCFA
jgi:hypothetical protein